MDNDAGAPYRVLARKYRPTSFKALIGQDVLVRTITRAIETDRLAQAYLLTGVRGVGKTSTARIIARALNCIGADGTGGPTPEPCGQCEHCTAIADDRHVDVIEMDAASRTGVNDIRELIDGVRYRPVTARYKVYIIDEVHMLSTQAFNALLKTLEEPPPHVIFVFATTEVRKVPVTVLSRCQRFDLRRVEEAVLAAHFKAIAEKEGASIDDDALAIIARAADGSVRDGLSLLDQAFAHANAAVTADAVRDMLGLADRTQIFTLFDLLMKGDAKAALENLGRQHSAGADPQVVLRDLMELCHWLTRLKVVPEAGDDPSVPEAERRQGGEMAAALSMPVLSRTWQMLLKGMEETQTAPRPLMAVEMVLIRLCHVASLPTPEEAIKSLADAPAPAGAAPAGPRPQGGGAGGTGERKGERMSHHAPAVAAQAAEAVPAAAPEDAPPEDAPRHAPEAQAQGAPSEPETGPAIDNLAAIVALADAAREPLLAAWLKNDVHPIRITPGQIEISGANNPPKDLLTKLRECLYGWTNRRWLVVLSEAPGAPTLAEMEAEQEAAARQRIAEDPIVSQILQMFPGAEVRNVRPRHDQPSGDEET